MTGSGNNNNKGGSPVGADPFITLSIEQAMKLSSQLKSDTARLDVECLLCHVLDCEAVYLRTWPEKHLSAVQSELFQSSLKRRQLGEPIAHICGKRAFWTLNLNVSPDTLIPRPDTEILVETILDLALPAQASILDMGTGTGAIALALASERPEWQVSATDFLPEIVALAKQNARIHHLQNVSVIQSDWFESLVGHRFDLIVSNPPYIDPDDCHLSEGDVRFEPRSALTAEDHGLADLSHIIRQAPVYLNSGGWLVLEHGYDQAEAVQAMFKQNAYRAIQTKQDYGQRDRMTMAQYRP